MLPWPSHQPHHAWTDPFWTTKIVPHTNLHTKKWRKFCISLWIHLVSLCTSLWHICYLYRWHLKVMKQLDNKAGYIMSFQLLMDDWTFFSLFQSIWSNMITCNFLQLACTHLCKIDSRPVYCLHNPYWTEIQGGEVDKTTINYHTKARRHYEQYCQGLCQSRGAKDALLYPWVLARTLVDTLPQSLSSTKLLDKLAEESCGAC